MNIRKGSLVKSFKIIINNQNFSLLQQQTQTTDIREKEIRMSISLLALKVLVKNYGVYSDLTK